MSVRSVLLLSGGVVIGSLIGVGLALLMAPQSGEETRNLIKARSSALKEQAQEDAVEAGHRIQEQVTVWEEKGKHTAEAISHGKDSVVGAIGHSKDSLVHAISRSKDDINARVAS